MDNNDIDGGDTNDDVGNEEKYDDVDNIDDDGGDGDDNCGDNRDNNDRNVMS